MPDLTKFIFSYLDQFDDVEVELKPYLKYMTEYDKKFRFSNWQPVRTKLKNLFYQSQIINNYLKNKMLFIKYTVQDGETIDYVSYKIYGVPDYWWVICVFNNIRNPFNDWVFTNTQLQDIAECLAKEEGLYPYETYYKLLFEENEKRRQIVILHPSEINNLVWDFVEHLREHIGMKNV